MRAFERHHALIRRLPRRPAAPTATINVWLARVERNHNLAVTHQARQRMAFLQRGRVPIGPQLGGGTQR